MGAPALAVSAGFAPKAVPKAEVVAAGVVLSPPNKDPPGTGVEVVAGVAAAGFGAAGVAPKRPPPPKAGAGVAPAPAGVAAAVSAGFVPKRLLPPKAGGGFVGVEVFAIPSAGFAPNRLPPPPKADTGAGLVPVVPAAAPPPNNALFAGFANGKD